MNTFPIFHNILEKPNISVIELKKISIVKNMNAFFEYYCIR